MPTGCVSVMAWGCLSVNDLLQPSPCPLLLTHVAVGGPHAPSSSYAIIPPSMDPYTLCRLCLCLPPNGYVYLHCNRHEVHFVYKNMGMSIYLCLFVFSVLHSYWFVTANTGTPSGRWVDG